VTPLLRGGALSPSGVHLKPTAMQQPPIFSHPGGASAPPAPPPPATPMTITAHLRTTIAEPALPYNQLSDRNARLSIQRYTHCRCLCETTDSTVIITKPPVASPLPAPK